MAAEQTEQKPDEAHRTQIDFGSARWDRMVHHGYRGSVKQVTCEMWDARLDKEEGLEMSGDENQLKNLQKKLGDALDARLKLLKLIDPEYPANTSIRERPVLVRFAKLFVAAGGHLASPGDIVNHKIKADFFKKVHEAEIKGDNVLSQRRHLFMDYLLAEKDVQQLERRISAPPEPSKPPLEVGGKNFADFTETKGPQSPESERTVFAPAKTVDAVDSTSKVTAQKAIDPGAMERLRDIVFEGPGGDIGISHSSPRGSPSHPSPSDKKSEAHG